MENMVILSGNTYEIRDSLKLVGGTYNPASKTWTLTKAAYDQICEPAWGRRTSRIAQGLRVVTPATTGAVCGRCNTYCYGDCDPR